MVSARHITNYLSVSGGDLKSGVAIFSSIPHFQGIKSGVVNINRMLIRFWLCAGIGEKAVWE
jgi:hypothetical protein